MTLLSSPEMIFALFTLIHLAGKGSELRAVRARSLSWEFSFTRSRGGHIFLNAICSAGLYAVLAAAFVSAGALPRIDVPGVLAATFAGAVAAAVEVYWPKRIAEPWTCKCTAKNIETRETCWNCDAIKKSPESGVGTSA